MGKKVAIGTVVGFITLFLLGWLVYGILMKDAMAEMSAAAGPTCMNSEPSMLHIILATLVQALLIAWVLAKFNANSFGSGFMDAGILSLLIGLMMAIWYLAMYPYYSQNAAIMEVLAGTVTGAIAGGVIGLVNGKVRSTPA